MKRDPYQEWLAEKRQVQVPEDFAEYRDGCVNDRASGLENSRVLGRRPPFSPSPSAGGIGRYAIAVYFVFFG